MTMNMRLILGVVVAPLMLAACASLENIVSAPNVSLRNVEVASLDFGEQKFLLSFDVYNPNPFPLPIKTVSYAVRLDGQRFASGEAASAFTVPAGSDGASSANGNLGGKQQVATKNEKRTERFIYFMLLCSLGLNVYLSLISRGFYVRYNELADELRETFTATI